ncbi:hypothetical protein DIPPA_31806 [Diplonema papillatum]|nr:hypothetical protein DIPPA_31806 [Diplonema papillatum]
MSTSPVTSIQTQPILAIPHRRRSSPLSYFEIYTDVLTPLSPVSRAVKMAGGTVLDKHAEVQGEARIFVAGPHSMAGLLEASLLSVEGVKRLRRRGAYDKGSRKESPTIQLHLVSPGGDWAPFSDAIMQAAARIITRYAHDNGFASVPRVYPYALTKQSLQIDVGDRALAAAMCNFDNLAFDSTQLFVPGLDVYASSLQVARKKGAYQNLFFTNASYTHSPYAFEYNALNRVNVAFTSNTN